MVYLFGIGGILFRIRSELFVQWSKEDLAFLCEEDTSGSVIEVTLRAVESLPRLRERILYVSDEMTVAADDQGREIRHYRTPLRNGNFEYACSVFDAGCVTVFIRDGEEAVRLSGKRVWSMLHMERLLLEQGGLILHCSYLVCDGKAILFSAPSGTGKTTQAKLWEKCYHARIVNGDKAVLRQRDGIWYACGYPFHGSAIECKNEAYPIEAIVLVAQSPGNAIERIPMAGRVGLVYTETTVNAWDSSAVDHALDLIADLAMHVPILRLKCTMDDAAAHLLYHHLRGV